MEAAVVSWTSHTGAYLSSYLLRMISSIIYAESSLDYKLESRSQEGFREFPVYIVLPLGVLKQSKIITNNGETCLKLLTK